MRRSIVGVVDLNMQMGKGPDERGEKEGYENVELSRVGAHQGTQQESHQSKTGGEKEGGRNVASSTPRGRCGKQEGAEKKAVG